MTRGELDIAVDWAAAEGWNPGQHDADCFYHTDPTGFLMGFLEGEPIASISAVKYGDSFGFIGFYIVKPEFRGQGHGLTLWNAALESLQGRNVGLDGVVAQQENYVKSGFSLAYRQIRYEGLGGSVGHASGCTPLTELPVERVINYDRQFFPEVRSRFIKPWVTHPQHHAIAVLEAQTLAGYGVLRPCRSGYKIGPLFADTATIADKIFRALVAQVPTGSPFYLDVPAVNSAAVSLAQRYEMHPIFETARMYTQSTPQLPLNRIFGITTFELG